MNTGLSEGRMHDFIRVLADRVGRQEADCAKEVLAEVLAGRN